MKRSATSSALCALWLLTTALSAPVLAQGLALGKGTDAKSRAEAAELSYLDDAAKGSSVAVAAALFWAPPAQFSAAAGSLQWDLALGINKNTVAGDKRVDKHLLALGGRHVMDWGADTHMASRAAVERRRNRLTGGDESAFSAVSTFDLQALKVFGPGFQLKPFPFLGVYRTSSRGNQGADARNGSYGGLFVGADLAFDLVKDAARWAILDVSVRRQWETQASGDFRPEDYTLGVAELKFPFTVSGSKGAVSLAHVRGTDRVGGTPWKRQTLLKFSLQFGSA